MHKNRQHPTEVECCLFCCPILLSRCRLYSFLKLLSYRHTAKGALVTVGACCGCKSGRHQTCSCCEHTQSPYGRFGTRRLLRDVGVVNSCVGIAAVNQLCVRNLQDSTDSPQIPKAGGDMLQGSECSGIYGIRIPSGPSGQLPCQCCKTKSSVDKCRCIL